MKTLRALVPISALLLGAPVLAADGGTAGHASPPAPVRVTTSSPKRATPKAEPKPEPKPKPKPKAKAVAEKPAPKKPAETAKPVAPKPKAVHTAKSAVPSKKVAASPVHVAKETRPARHETDTVVPLSGERDDVLDTARAFFDALLQGEPEKALESAGLPFWLEARKIDDHDALLRAWNQALGDERVDLLTLYSIELLTPKEMLTRYGKPPKRLAGFPWQGRDRYIAIANLSGHAAIAVLAKLSNGNWRVIGYTD